MEQQILNADRMSMAGTTLLSVTCTGSNFGNDVLVATRFGSEPTRHFRYTPVESQRQLDRIADLHMRVMVRRQRRGATS